MRRRRGGHRRRWVLAALLLLLVVALAGSWAPDRPVEALAARWAPPPSTFVEVQGMRVHLRDEGPRDDPSPIILLHGTSASLHTWEGWVARLRGSERVISLDLPGFGLTGPMAGDDYRVARYVDFMRALMDELELPSAVVGGNSFGGQVAMELALAEPARVQALVLVDALAYPPEPESLPLGFTLARQPWAIAVMRYFLPKAVIAASVRDVYGDPSRVSPDLVERYYELSLRAGNREALGKRMQQFPTAADAGRPARVQAPTLVIWGERDRLIPLAQGERLHRDIAGSRMVVFPGLGHVPQEEDPEATVVVVRDFLEGR